MGIGLYIHIPFCKRKCPYCDFYSLEYEDSLADGYIKAVLRNIEHYGEIYGKIEVDTIYFGGGTPSLLKPEMFGEILEKTAKTFILTSPEISLEANPCTVSLQKLKDLYRVGFNRISFGVQSLCDNELKLLGRLHDSKTAIKAIENAYSAGFKDISADLMLGIIGQDIYSLDNNIKKLTQLPLTHISAYMLKVEQGTAYDTPKIYEQIPDEDMVADLYLHTIEALEIAGFPQYEISNFSRKGYECKHNLHYWRCEEYIGIGPSAHSFFGGKRYAVPRSLNDFIDDEFQNEQMTDENPASFSEYAMLQIRLIEGLNLEFCRDKYFVNIEEILEKSMHLEKNGLMKIQNNRIILTPKGCLVSNQIIGRLFL